MLYSNIDTNLSLTDAIVIPFAIFLYFKLEKVAVTFLFVQIAKKSAKSIYISKSVYSLWFYANKSIRNHDLKKNQYKNPGRYGIPRQFDFFQFLAITGHPIHCDLAHLQSLNNFERLVFICYLAYFACMAMRLLQYVPSWCLIFEGKIWQLRRKLRGNYTVTSTSTLKIYISQMSWLD